MVGAWRFVEHCRHRPQPPAHWRSYAARFIVFRLRDAARAGYGATANRADRMRPADALEERNPDWLADRKAPRPSDRAEREDFWRRACRGLTARQREAVLLVHRDRLGTAPAARAMGVGESRLSVILRDAERALPHNLRSQRPTPRRSPARREASEDRSHVVGGRLWACCDAVIGTGASGNGQADHRRAAVGSIRYRMCHGDVDWRAMPPDLAGEMTTGRWARRWRKDGTLERLRAILAEDIARATGAEPRKGVPR